MSKTEEKTPEVERVRNFFVFLDDEVPIELHLFVDGFTRRFNLSFDQARRLGEVLLQMAGGAE